METIRFSFPKVHEACIAALIALLQAVPSRSPLVGAHILEGSGFEEEPTCELALRGRPDEQIDGVILIETADHATLEAVAGTMLTNAALTATGAGTLLRGIYQLQYSLSSADVSTRARCWSR